MKTADFKTDIINELTALLSQQQVLFSEVNESEYAWKRVPGKWSRKEIIGHLIDSAQNNIQRFIRGQYETGSSIRYEQDTWVRLNGYQEASLSDLITLWFLLNRQIIRIIDKMPTGNFERTSMIGDQAYSLQWLMEDYVRHLKHHLVQINESWDSH
jgi:hypothetical protein